MNNKDFDEQEYLKQCLIRDMLSAKGVLKTYVEVVETMKQEKEKLHQEVEDWKYKCVKLDDEMCELKKENVRLKENIKDLEQELLKKAIIECEPKEKGKPGRKPKEVK